MLNKMGCHVRVNDSKNHLLNILCGTNPITANAGLGADWRDPKFDSASFVSPLAVGGGMLVVELWNGAVTRGGWCSNDVH